MRSSTSKSRQKPGALIDALEQALGTVTSKSPRERSVALLCKIKEWNQEPPCAAKVKIIFNQLGLHPPSDKLC